MTKQKEAIYHIINDSMEHMTADIIFTKARNIIPNVSLGTVYRNLGVMCSEGLIRKVTTPSGKDVYDKNVIPHAHSICVNCGKIMDYHNEQINKILIDDFKGRLKSYEFVINVECEDCIVNQIKES